MFLLARFREQVLQALLEITPVLGARRQRAQIQGVDGGVEQRLGHPLFHDHPRQPLGDGGLADTRLAHRQGVVLAAAAAALESGSDALSAAIKAAEVEELNEKNTTVGYGGAPDREGNVTLDASVMDHLGNCGSVVAVENIVHVAALARDVMEKTPHVMLAWNKL